MKWLSGPAVLVLFVLLLLLGRGQAVWDGILGSLVAVSPDTAVSLPAPLTSQGNCQSAHLVGRDLLLQEQAEAALPYLETAVTCDNDRWAWFDLGRVQVALGQVEAAAQSWQKADAYEHVVRLAAMAKADGDAAGEQAAWALAALVEPQNGQPYVQMGRLVMNEEPEQARQFYEQAIAAEPANAQAHHALGNLYLQQFKSPEQAQPYFEQAHQLAPEKVEYLQSLAQNSGRFDMAQAIQYWQELAVLSEASQPTAYHSMGKLWLQAGDAAQARPYLEQAMALRPQNAEIWRTLAESYEMLGCTVEAKGAYEQIMALKPDSQLAEDAQGRLVELAALPEATCP